MYRPSVSFNNSTMTLPLSVLTWSKAPVFVSPVIKLSKYVHVFPPSSLTRAMASSLVSSTCSSVTLILSSLPSLNVIVRASSLSKAANEVSSQSSSFCPLLFFSTFISSEFEKATLSIWLISAMISPNLSRSAVVGDTSTPPFSGSTSLFLYPF